jgi:hypothetical protein
LLTDPVVEQEVNKNERTKRKPKKRLIITRKFLSRKGSLIILKGLPIKAFEFATRPLSVAGIRKGIFFVLMPLKKSIFVQIFVLYGFK